MLDDIAHAAERGRLGLVSASLALSADTLGPLIELDQYAANGRLPSPDAAPWLKLNGFQGFFSSLRKKHARWVCPHTQDRGFFRLSEAYPSDDTPWVQFGLEVQKAVVSAGLPKAVGGQFVGAMGELASNVYEHSGNSSSGLVAFHAYQGRFDFVIADRGIGILESLKSCSEFKDLEDAGEALDMALKENVSRHGTNVGRGKGFRPLFQGLANYNGFLRFRSDDHALTLDGRNPGSIPASLSQKSKIKGFMASVSCKA